LNGLHNVTFFHENLEEDVTRQAWAKQGFDKILLDPARRRGGRDAHIIKLAPRAWSMFPVIRRRWRAIATVAGGYTRFNAWRCWICSRTPDIWNQWCCLSTDLFV
jgi:hypothetical protein